MDNKLNYKYLKFKYLGCLMTTNTYLYNQLIVTQISCLIPFKLMEMMVLERLL